jgi:hypothetical protein
VKKLIVALTLTVLVCCSGLVSANPYWAHDEPQELILPLALAALGCFAGVIFLFWFNRTESKSEAASP